MNTGATMNRHRSRQDYETPAEFIRAVEDRFGPLTVDLAATKQNAKAPEFLDEEANSLTVNWNKFNGLLWLNPPFNHIEIWAQKSRMHCELGARLLFLTPASVGSEWFQMHVLGRAMVLALSPRLSFDGKAPYPKDCMLSVFWAGCSGFDVWRWK